MRTNIDTLSNNDDDGVDGKKDYEMNPQPQPIAVRNQCFLWTNYHYVFLSAQPPALPASPHATLCMYICPTAHPAFNMCMCAMSFRAM